MRSNSDPDHEDMSFIGSQTCPNTCYILLNNWNIRLYYSITIRNNKVYFYKKIKFFLSKCVSLFSVCLANILIQPC